MENLKAYFDRLSNLTLSVHIAVGIIVSGVLLGYIGITLPGLVLTVILGTLLGIFLLMLVLLIYTFLEPSRKEP